MLEVATPRPGLFMCSRASMYSEKPCEEAFKALVPYTDIRTVDDPAKLRGISNDWYERGTNHRVINGQIARDLGPREEWMVEVHDLLAFVAKYGDCVLSVESNGFMSIEIYDSYRE